MAGRPDFAEGVRAVLVHKDGLARWSSDVPKAAISAEIDAVSAGWAAGRRSQV
jgi:hypothetical protein